ncbi:MAG: hypothetical protein A3G24_22315 [Betaproteobacteria bacterium RIFCSPLOWO2_12_FULL_62_13]|nr:MAG: hypothetical protein A3G24_22315 [Betaproteobacteria bacterium RIFCSPLOWO2_12_FULL_62_13]
MIGETLIDAARASLESVQRGADGVAPPVAILWTDADGQWQPIIPALRNAMPQLYVLGSYDPKTHTGPVIWLKCIVEHTLRDAPEYGVTPVLYLPRVSRQDLRAGGDCPPALQPLVELQYRGAVWHQKNGRDWTVDAFLSSESGCGLDIARDNRTQEAMLRALPLLAIEPLAALRGRRLESDNFDALAIGDPIRDLLTWMSEPKTFEARCDSATYATFRDVCRREFGFDPEKDGPLAAGDALLNGSGKWESVWHRFTEAPQLYDGVAERLREAKPRDLLVDRSRQPTVNEEEEQQLRRDLAVAAGLSHRDACSRVLELETRHRERRGWVWTQLGESPLALALAPLQRLADLARKPLGGPTVEAMVADYTTDGWHCDRVALEALASVTTTADVDLVSKVVRALYEPWLDRSARRFQELVAGTDAANLSTGVPAEKDTCVLFADGLRFDVGGLLAARLEGRGLRVRLSHRVAPLPTVTATAKPMASPAHRVVAGGQTAEDFLPLIAGSGQPAIASRLRNEMARMGVDVLEPDEVRFASGAQGGGWCEIGKLDEIGHSLGARLAREIKTEVDTIADRVVELLSAGWPRVRVVTDHGWLLLPGGLPKVELPAHLVATRWARCAAVRGESSTDVPTYSWHWNAHARIASPPGIGSFVAGNEYAHGGVSLQECVVPELFVERGEEAVHGKIISINWRGMRCRVTVESKATGLRVDLRLNWKQASSSIAVSPKEIDAGGEVSLAVADDKHEGAAATVVLLDAAGSVLDYKPTTVGEGK